MAKLKLFRLLALTVMVGVLLSGCGPSDEEKNEYRRENKYPGRIDVPVAFLASEWGGMPRILASGWLVDKEQGMFLNAKHYTDVFMGDSIELGSGECKIFFNAKVYECYVVKVPPLRDASVLKISSPYNPADFPEPYKIAETPVKVGDTVYVQGFHPHSQKISESNTEEGFPDLIFPIRKLYYEVRMADPKKQMEIVFDSLEAKVTKINNHIRIDEGQLADDLLKFELNTYFEVKTVRNHKFSFGGLSGGVVVRVRKDGQKEAVGIITAEKPVRIEYDSKKRMIAPDFGNIPVADTLNITPIESVKDLLDYIKYQR